MNKFITVIAACLFSAMSFAQFGGGLGTESDPYRIYTIAHLEEIGDSLNNNNDLYGKHLRLMNDIIEDSLANMLGNFEGVGFCGSCMENESVMVVFELFAAAIISVTLDNKLLQWQESKVK